MNSSITLPIKIIGAGLAGSECAWQLAKRGISVELYEMRPKKLTPAHKTGNFAELVCSNSLKSVDPLHPAGILKKEMELLDSLIIKTAKQFALPAGKALAVDREKFSKKITETLNQHSNIKVINEEVKEIPSGTTVIATGPLTSDALTQEIIKITGEKFLYFYDAISPIVYADSINYEKMFFGSRYEDSDDYLNSPLTEQEYYKFWHELVNAEVTNLKDFEKLIFFEACLPIEEMARRGKNTLLYGPLKPIGLKSPFPKKMYAVVQLRRETLDNDSFSMVGFQTRLKWGEQKRVFRLIPGLEEAEFVRFGQMHRNTYINAPKELDIFYRLKKEPNIFLAGQITGVEGYLESAATGLVVALYIYQFLNGEPNPLPFTTALGALGRHLTLSNPKNFQPSGITLGMFLPPSKKMKRKEKAKFVAIRAKKEIEEWIEKVVAKY